MKKGIILILSLLLFAHVDANAQLGRIKKMGRSVVKTTKKAGSSIKKKAEQGASYTWDKTKQGARVTTNKARQGGSYLAGKTKQGASYTWDKTKQGARVTSNKVEQGGSYAWDKTKDGASYTWDKAKQAGRYSVKVASKILAAAIADARNRYLPHSRPIPRAVRERLKEFFPESLINNARYTIGQVEITLPNVINRTTQAVRYGDNHAVTVGNVIVFRKDPGGFSDFWVHEMTHVEQYQRLGISNFAYKYMLTLGRSLESEAEAKARESRL